MACDLREKRPRDALNRESEGRVLDRRLMPEIPEHFEKRFDLVRGKIFVKRVDVALRVAELRGFGDELFSVRRVCYQLAFHEISSSFYDFFFAFPLSL